MLDWVMAESCKYRGSNKIMSDVVKVQSLSFIACGASKNKACGQ